MRERSRGLTIARGAALFFAVAAVTALVLWTQTREVRRAPQVVPPPTPAAAPTAPAAAPTDLATTPAPAPTPPAAIGVAGAPEVPPPPADADAADRRIFFSTSKAMMAPPLDPPDVQQAPPTPPQAPLPALDRVHFSSSKSLMAPNLDLDSPDTIQAPDGGSGER